MFLVVLFSVLFIIYYNKLDTFQKDKEVYLNNKEKELKSREKRIEDIETLNDRLNKCEDTISQISGLLHTDKN